MTKGEMVKYLENVPDDASVFIGTKTEEMSFALSEITIMTDPVNEKTDVFLDYEN